MNVCGLQGALAAVAALGGGGLRARGGIVLAYHDISDEPRAQTHYTVTPGRFRAQVSAALQWGLRLVALDELCAALERGAPVDGLGAITFDDALLGVHRHAAPILEELRVPATVFAVSGIWGAPPSWWPGSARTLTRQELRELAALGFSVGAHTRTHPRLPKVSPRRLEDEVSGSRSDLEDLLGARVDQFAYPQGEHSSSVRAAVARAGYRAAWTFHNGRLLPGADPHRLARLGMWQGQGRLRLAYHLARPAASWPRPDSEAAERSP